MFLFQDRLISNQIKLRLFIIIIINLFYCISLFCFDLECIAIASQAKFEIDPNLLHTRDPFQMPTVPVTRELEKSPLEKYAAEEFKLIGALTGSGSFKALIQDPTGKTHILSENMKIGMHSGTVTKISPDAVIIRELKLNPLGEKESFYTTLSIEKASGGADLKQEVEQSPQSQPQFQSQPTYPSTNPGASSGN